MDDTTRITVALPQPVLVRLDAYAGEHRWSRSTAAAALIEQALSTEGDEADGPS